MRPPDPPWPSSAYLPGLTARPAEGTYDPIRDTVRPGMSPETLAQTDAFRHGLRFLEEGFFWEAHELLEPVWMALPPDSADRAMVQALIQLANGRLKLRMQRPKAALRLAGIARSILPLEPASIMGLDPGRISAQIDSLEAVACAAL